MDLISPAYTRALGEVIREIEPDVTQYLGAKYMPAVERPTNDVFVDVWERSGGATLESSLDADTQSIQKKSFRTERFSAGVYREMIRFGESDILRLRELGTNDLSKRGIQQHIEENAKRLNDRLETRMEIMRWGALLQGSYIYDNRQVNFGVPAVNQVSPLVNWATVDANGVPTANPNAKPIQDLRYWLTGGYAPYRIYGKIEGIVCNPTTARMIIENSAVMQQIYPAITGGRLQSYDLAGIMNFLLPGLPQVEVYDGSYLAESVDPTTGKISTGYTTYFIPDGVIWFRPNLRNAGGQIGEISMTLNLSNGSIAAPTAGKYVLTDMTGLQSMTRAPHMALVAGFNGGPALTRPFDVLTAKVF